MKQFIITMYDVLVNGAKKRPLLSFIGLVVVGGAGMSIWIPSFQMAQTLFEKNEATVVMAPVHAKHVVTPESVRAIYMTAWVASLPKWRGELAHLIDTTELNSVVIDVKDFSGKIFFDTQDEYFRNLGVEEIRARDLREFIDELHSRDIYVIARISVFQDQTFVKLFPEYAVKRADGVTIWRDRNGIAWVDPAARPFWEYIARVSKAAEAIGFDELNFDYIRFPSDGNMRDMQYPFAGPQALTTSRSTTTRAQILGDFFAYLNDELSSLPVPISADLFGMVTVNTDDLNIGQVLEVTAPHFDYIAPMMYPSHYPAGFNGFSKPVTKPYEILFHGAQQAKERLIAIGQDPKKLRPWIQDFDLGATYDATMIRKQMQGIYDNGLGSWMMWDASNKYTRGAYLLEE